MQPPAARRPPGAPTSGTPAASTQRPSARERCEKVQLRRSLGLVAMTLLVPGSAQLAAGNRRLGRWAVRVWLVLVSLVVAFAVLFLVARGAAVGLVATSWVVKLVTAVVVVGGIGWALLLLDALRLSRPVTMRRRHGAVVGAVSGALALALGVGACGVGSALNAQANLLGSVFGGGGETSVQAGRYNILLLGADAGKGRTGLRPDSITVASVDATSGRTVLFSLPRNLEGVRFPASSPLHALYPDGYDCPSHACMLNAVYTLAEQHKQLYKHTQHPGIVATREAVEETLGLTINYYAMVDLVGFEALIDAVGGITLDVSKAVPIGGGTSPIYGYVGPGKNLRLDGFHALWFARSREGSSDFERMVRQKCVMNAMLNQLDPFTVLTKFNDIAAAGKQIVTTDVPAGEANTLLELAQKAKAKRVASVSFAPPLIYSGNPDYALIRRVVAEKIATAEQADEPKPAATATTTAKPATSPSAASRTTASPAPRTTSSAQRSTDDLEALCGAS